MNDNRNSNIRGIIAAGVLASAAMLATEHVVADESSHSTEPVYWFFDTDNPVGSAQLIREPDGITAIFHASELPPGQAVTLWFIIFNNPENCLSDPCSVPFDLFTPGVDGDFHFGGGNVTGGSGRATFAGHLQVGDVSGSGMIEAALGPAAALADPAKVEVVLAAHSHGPKLRGVLLKQQLNSFLGGCSVFNGPNGFAASPDDLPDSMGECSTIQFSHHEP